MKKYLICSYVNENYEKVYVSVDTENVIEKGDLVVFEDYDMPALAKVEKEMDELKAITSDYHFNECISFVNMKDYLQKKAKEIQKAKLIKMMKEQIELQKLEDTLKKNSECNSTMAELFSKYKEL